MASRSMGVLTLDLIARTGGFESGMDKAARHSSKRMKEIEREAKMLGKAIAGALVAAAGTVAYNVGKTINEMDRLAKSSQAIGVTVEQLSSLEFAARLSGVSSEALGTSLQRLSRGMSDAARGTGTAKLAFESLNVEFKNTDGTLRDSEQVMKDVADRFAGMEDGAEKTALAMEIFGRSGAALIPLLNQGADGINKMQLEAAQLGLVMSTQTARAAEQFNDDLFRLQSVMTGVWREMTASLLPALNTFTGLLVDAQRESGGLATDFDAMTERMVRAVAFIADAADGLVRAFQIVGRGGVVAFITMRREALRFADGIINGPTKAINGMIELYNRWSPIKIDARAPNISGAIARELELTKQMLAEGLADIDAIMMEPMAGDAIRARFEQVRQEMETLPARARVVAPEMEEAIGGSMERGAARATKAVSDFDADLKALFDSGKRVFDETRTPLEQFGARIEELNILLQVGAIDWDTYSRAVEKAQDQFGSADMDLSVQIAELNGLLQSGAMDWDTYTLAVANVHGEFERASKSTKQFADSARRVFDATRTPLERFKAQIMELNDLVLSGALDWDTYGRAVAAAQGDFERSMDAMKDKNKKANEEMSQFSIQAARSMQSAFADFLFDPFTKGVNGMLQDFLRVLQRMAAEAAAAKIFEAIGGIFSGNGVRSGGGSGGLGTIIGGAIGSAFGPVGTAIGSVIGGLFADGGVTAPGKAYVVGERGPELFVPNQVGTVVPNHEMGMGSNVRIINVIDPNLVADYLNSPGGDRVILNTLQRNAGPVRQILA